MDRWHPQRHHCGDSLGPLQRPPAVGSDRAPGKDDQPRCRWGSGFGLAKAAELIKVEESGGALLRLASCVDKTSGRDQALCRGF